jgi:1-acyl-sn-glycerol-3-phosphate acyltransferase
MDNELTIKNALNTDKNLIYKNDINQDIIINNMCFCKTYFSYNKEKISLLLPCSHFVHEKCINEYLYSNILIIKNLLNKLECPICKMPVDDIVSEKKIRRNKKLIQYKTDLDSVKLYDSGDFSYVMIPLTILKLNTFLNKLIISETEKDLLDALEIFLRSANIKINIIDNTQNNPIKFENNRVEWIKKKDILTNKVLISNHSHYLDSFILYYLFKSGFVAGEFINKSDIGRIIALKCKLLIFDRNKDTNMVNKIKQYLQEKKIITIFPEGAQSNQNTLLRFRTGAFYTDAPICPIIIKYHPYIWDDDIKNLILKIFTQNQITIDVIINDFVYPPFDLDKINKIRNFMGKVGNLQLSRVSNKSN